MQNTKTENTNQICKLCDQIISGGWHEVIEHYNDEHRSLPLNEQDEFCESCTEWHS